MEVSQEDSEGEGRGEESGGNKDTKRQDRQRGRE